MRKNLKDIARDYLRGAAHLFDFAGALAPTIEPPKRQPSSMRVLRADMARLGRDMRRAYDRVAQDHARAHS